MATLDYLKLAFKLFGWLSWKPESSWGPGLSWGLEHSWELRFEQRRVACCFAALGVVREAVFFT